MKETTKSAVAVAAESKFAVGARAAIDNLSRVMRKCGIKDLKTKLSLGDFEGNTCHRKFSVGTDDGRLYLSYELNGRDRDVGLRLRGNRAQRRGYGELLVGDRDEVRWHRSG